MLGEEQRPTSADSSNDSRTRKVKKQKAIKKKDEFGNYRYYNPNTGEDVTEKVKKQREKKAANTTLNEDHVVEAVVHRPTTPLAFSPVKALENGNRSDDSPQQEKLRDEPNEREENQLDNNRQDSDEDMAKNKEEEERGSDQLLLNAKNGSDNEEPAIVTPPPTNRQRPYETHEDENNFEVFQVKHPSPQQSDNASDSSDVSRQRFLAANDPIRSRSVSSLESPEEDVGKRRNRRKRRPKVQQETNSDVEQEEGLQKQDIISEGSSSEEHEPTEKQTIDNDPIQELYRENPNPAPVSQTNEPQNNTFYSTAAITKFLRKGVNFLKTLSFIDPKQEPTIKSHKHALFDASKNVYSGKMSQPILMLQIVGADMLTLDANLAHPSVRVSVCDINTGQYLKIDSLDDASPEMVLPQMTLPYNMKKTKSLVPIWNDYLYYDILYNNFLKDNVVFIFELIDFSFE